jgi:hypothetical protein
VLGRPAHAHPHPNRYDHADAHQTTDYPAGARHGHADQEARSGSPPGSTHGHSATAATADETATDPATADPATADETAGNRAPDAYGRATVATAYFCTLEDFSRCVTH